MPRYLIAAMLAVCSASVALAEETFYIVYDSTMKGCTIATTEPTDTENFKVLGKDKSNEEAVKAIASMKQC
jgi:hypothetical protein